MEYSVLWDIVGLRNPPKIENSDHPSIEYIEVNCEGVQMPLRMTINVTIVFWGTYKTLYEILCTPEAFRTRWRYAQMIGL